MVQLPQEESGASHHWRSQAAVTAWRHSTRPLASGVYDRAIERPERSHHTRRVGAAAGWSSRTNLRGAVNFRDRLEERRRVRSGTYYQAAEAKGPERRCPFRVAPFLAYKKPSARLCRLECVGLTFPQISTIL